MDNRLREMLDNLTELGGGPFVERFTQAAKNLKPELSEEEWAKWRKRGWSKTDPNIKPDDDEPPTSEWAIPFDL